MSSMFGGLKKRALLKKLRSNKNLKKVEIKPLDSYKNILIVSEDPQHQVVNSLKEIFPNSSSQQLFERQKKEDETRSDEFSVHDADFNLSGAIKNVKLSKLLNESFDLVLDLSRNSVPLSYFIGSVKADLVVGKLSGNGKLHDLSVNDGANEKEFLENVKSQITLLSAHGR